MRTIPSLFALIVLYACAATAQAQPVLNFKRIVSNWPTIELYFASSCKGQPSYFTDKRYFRVEENGLDVQDFELWCPDPSFDCWGTSTVLVFDASGSMAGAGNAAAKAAGHAFIDMAIDGVMSEAAIIWFNTMVNVQQGMTTSPDLLHTAVNALPASGATAAWDGIYQGVLELINNGVNQCRAVIALTDGYDNSSSLGPAEVIALAQRNRVHVFTIGLGSSVSAAQLRAIAEQTGGRYYETPTAASLPSIYLEILALMVQGFQECLITYQAQCMDGTSRDVTLTLQNTCGGSDTRTLAYTAPYYPSTFEPLRFRLGSREARSSGAVVIPVELLDTVPGPAVFNPVQFTVTCNPQLARFIGVRAPWYSPLAGLPLSATDSAGKVTVSSPQRRMISVTHAPCTLFELVYEAADPGLPDSLHCPLSFSSLLFYDGGCSLPRLESGEIIFMQGDIPLRCFSQGPDSLVWNSTAQAYAPNPFTAGMTVLNSGNRAAESATFRIAFDPGALELVSPADSVMPGQPAAVPPLGTTHAEFRLRALPRARGDFVSVCIEARFGNALPVMCCRSFWVPAARAEFHCALAVPDIAADTVMWRYSPMPFEVTLAVTNSSAIPSDTIDADLSILPPLVPAGADSGATRKRLLPPVLQPGQTGTVSWTLSHPVSASDTVCSIAVAVSASNCDSAFCNGVVRIPGLGIPIPGIAVEPDTLNFGTVLLGSSGTLQVLLHNDGRADLLASAAIIGPDASSFNVTAQPFDPLIPHGTGYCTVVFQPDSVGVKRAVLRITSNDPKRPVVDVVLLAICGPRRPRLYTSSDTLNFGSVTMGSNRELNVHAGNTGTAMLHVTTQSAGGDFTIVQRLPDSLAPGSYGDLRIRFTPVAVGKSTASAFIVSDDTTRQTAGILLTGYGMASIIAFSEKRLDFGLMTLDVPRMLQLTISNNGTADLILSKQSVTGRDSAEFGIATPANTPVAPGRQSVMILRFRPMSPGSKAAELVIASNSLTDSIATIPLTGNGRTVAAEEPAGLPSEPQLAPAWPNPFVTGTSISYMLPAAMHVRLWVTDALGREVALLAYGAAAAGAHTTTFDASALPAGVYFAVLRCGGRAKTLPLVKARNP